MATKYYAWAPIKTTTGVIEIGKEVTPEKLGVGKDEFANLIASRAIRSNAFPQIPKTYQGSPKNYLRKQLREMQESMEENAFDSAVALYEDEGSE